MNIRTVSHKGLRRLIESGDSSGVSGVYAEKLETIIGFLVAASDIEAIQKLQTWKAHQLTGHRKGTWSLTVSRNWRITFWINAENEIEDLDFEDYH